MADLLVLTPAHAGAADVLPALALLSHRMRVVAPLPSAMLDAMDADVISIENSRSNEELLRAFTTKKYERMIGPGVYDIHSPAIPTTDEIVARLNHAAGVLGSEILWVNPDCGLKTRKDEEVWPSLEHMVAAARAMRETAAAGT